MEVEIEFFYDEFGMLKVNTSEKYNLIGCFLTDINYEQGVNFILNKINKKISNISFWERSYNKTFLELHPDHATIGDLFEDSKKLKVSYNNFYSILEAWKMYIISNKKTKKVFRLKISSI